MCNSLISVFLVPLTALSLVLSGCRPLISPPYDYSRPVPASEQREDSWFDDSADTGLSAAGVPSRSQFSLPDGGTGTLADGLGQKDFSKVYIMLGINEISTSRDRFKEKMSAVIQLVRDNQPEGIPIYVLNITPTTRTKSDSSDFNQTNVKRLNEVLAELCEEQECYLVDLWSCFADENGYLPEDKSTDGVHLKAPQYRVMADYILSHTVK